MKLFNGKVGVVIIGPPGSGKGTQAELLSKKLDLFHFDTGVFLRKLLYSPTKNKEILKERKLNESGKLNTPAWVLKVVSQRVKEISKLGQSIVFSGSPRSEFEAFGDKKNKGLIEILAKEYGKKNLFVFNIEIPEKESVKRNKKRMTCLVCRSPIMSGDKKMASCPFCGGRLQIRKDDKEEIIKLRLEEYRDRTFPILKKLKSKGYRVIKINGQPLPYKIHQRIISFFG